MTNHKTMRHGGGTKSQIGLVIAWGKNWWPIRVFAFLVAYTEVNAHLAMKCFLKTDFSFIDFQ